MFMFIHLRRYALVFCYNKNMEITSDNPAEKPKSESSHYQKNEHSKVTRNTSPDDRSGSGAPGPSNSLKRSSQSLPEQLLQIEIKYSEFFSYLKFEYPIAFVYNPIKYAYNLHSQFVYKFCQSEKDILFLGMNPGPWGMSQTGVPFGEVSVVRDWLEISGEVEHPTPENPNRPITGLTCHRSEISGKRFWGALQKVFGKDPCQCLKTAFVHNYCPVALLTETGKNITPPELRARERQELFRLCDDLLIEVLLLLNIKTVVAIGKFAGTQAKAVIKKARLDSLKLLSIPHPSPRNAGVSNTWETKAVKTLKYLLPTVN